MEQSAAMPASMSTQSDNRQLSANEWSILNGTHSRHYFQGTPKMLQGNTKETHRICGDRHHNVARKAEMSDELRL